MESCKLLCPVLKRVQHKVQRSLGTTSLYSQVHIDPLTGNWEEEGGAAITVLQEPSCNTPAKLAVTPDEGSRWGSPSKPGP